jgi:FKBP-type peptidyl-prolyl cis-trans isomerase FkpA
VTSSGLQIIDVIIGTGTTAKLSDCLTLRYTGWLQDGTIFGSSALVGHAVSTGLDNVLPGLKDGIPGMKVGGVRRLIIPPALAFGLYGNSSGSIPPNATLTYDIELVSIP